MINLFHAEFYKLRKSSFIKIAFIICAICAVSMAFVSNQVQTGNVPASALGSASGLCEAMVVSLLGSLAIGTIICTDFESKSIHDEITCKHGRLSVVIVKVVMSLVAILILMIPYGVTALIALASGTEFSKMFVASAFARIMSSGVEVSASSIGSIIVITIAVALAHTARIAICIPLAFKIKKSAIIMAIGFTFSAFMSFLTSLIEKDSFFDKLIKWTPFCNDYAMVTMDTDAGAIVKGLIISAIFIAVIGFITYRLFRRAEIK